MAAGDQQGAWLVVTLLFLFMLINFADKAVIGMNRNSRATPSHAPFWSLAAMLSPAGLLNLVRAVT